MKLNLIGSVAVLSALMVSQLTMAHDLRLHIDKIKSNKGVMLVALHNQQESYDANTPTVAAKKLALSGGELIVEFGDLPAGTYAIKLYQDENENGVIDKSFMGIPTEGYGFSNNGGEYGQPSFKEASFTLDKDLQVDIHLR